VVADNGNRVRYFHYNDLGTVLAQTKADGTMEGLWQPDFFGNYCDTGIYYTDGYAYPGSPDRPELGLTGKQYDSAAGTYYSGARWLDCERGRFVSPDPLGFVDGPNLYAFVANDPVNSYDPDGMFIITAWCMSKIANEVNRNYDGDPPYDKFKHCLVSCRAVRECGLYGINPLTPGWVWLLGIAHEVIGGGDYDSSDVAANEDGITYGGVICNKGKGCEELCAKKHPARNR
jgi:RHS repeat-associated protein